MFQDQVKCFFFAFLEEIGFLLGELVDQLRQKVESVGLVLSIRIWSAYNIYDSINDIGLGEDLETGIVFTEVAQSLRCVQRHMYIVILERQLVNERAEDHGGFVLEDLLHLLLFFIKQLRSISFVIAAVWTVPLVFFLGLNLLFDQLDHQRCQRMLIQVT